MWQFTCCTLFASHDISATQEISMRLPPADVVDSHATHGSRLLLKRPASGRMTIGGTAVWCWDMHALVRGGRDTGCHADCSMKRQASSAPPRRLQQIIEPSMRSTRLVGTRCGPQLQPPRVVQKKALTATVTPVTPQCPIVAQRRSHLPSPAA